MQEEGAGERRPEARQSPRARLRRAVGGEELGPGRRRARRASSASSSVSTAPGRELGVLVEQQAELAARLGEQAGVVLGLAGPALERDQPGRAGERRSGSIHARTASAEPSSEALSSTSSSASTPAGWATRDRRQAR